MAQEDPIHQPQDTELELQYELGVVLAMGLGNLPVVRV